MMVFILGYNIWCESQEEKQKSLYLNGDNRVECKGDQTASQQTWICVLVLPFVSLVTSENQVQLSYP